MTVTNFFDEFEFDIFCHFIVVLANSEYVCDDIFRRIAKFPKMVHSFKGFINIGEHAVIQHISHKQGMRFITYLDKRVCNSDKKKIENWRNTLKTFSELTNPKPSLVDCKLLSACLISPWAVKTIASRPSSL